MLNFFESFDYATLTNLIAIGALLYFVTRNQKKLRQDLLKIQEGGQQNSAATLRHPTTARADEKNFFQRYFHRKKTPAQQKYSLDFIPVLRFSHFYREHTPAITQILENFADMAIHNEKLQREFVQLTKWCESCGIYLDQSENQVFQFAIKRFRQDRYHEQATFYPEQIFAKVFTDFEIKHSLVGDKFKSQAEDIAKHSDIFIHNLLEQHLNPLDGALLLSLMSGFRVAIHLELLSPIRRQRIFRAMPRMLKKLNQSMILRLMKNIEACYSPITSSNCNDDIRHYLCKIVDNLDPSYAEDLLHSFKKERIPSKILPHTITRPSHNLLSSQASRKPDDIKAIAITDHAVPKPAAPNLPLSRDEIFTRFCEATNPDSQEAR